MPVQSGLQDNYQPNVYRTVTASTNLKTVSGIPARCACRLIITNGDALVQTVVFTGADAVNVTIVIPTMTTVELTGSFSTTGAFSDSDVTCVAGWIDDGSVVVNA